MFTRSRTTAALAALLLTGTLTACGSSTDSASTPSGSGSSSSSSEPMSSTSTMSMSPTETSSSSSSSSTSSETGRIGPITIEDGWAKAAETGMSAAFGTLVNNASQPVHITGATCPAAGKVELHEVVKNAAGAMVMRPTKDGFTIPAGGKLVLEPGSFHIMLMMLTEPLVNGKAIDITLQTDLGDVPLAVPVRTFSGGDESYEPSPSS